MQASTGGHCQTGVPSTAASGAALPLQARSDTLSCRRGPSPKGSTESTASSSSSASAYEDGTCRSHTPQYSPRQRPLRKGLHKNNRHTLTHRPPPLTMVPAQRTSYVDTIRADCVSHRFQEHNRVSFPYSAMYMAPEMWLFRQAGLGGWQCCFSLHDYRHVRTHLAELQCPLLLAQAQGLEDFPKTPVGRVAHVRQLPLQLCALPCTASSALVRRQATWPSAVRLSPSPFHLHQGAHPFIRVANSCQPWSSTCTVLWRHQLCICINQECIWSLAIQVTLQGIITYTRLQRTSTMHRPHGYTQSSSRRTMPFAV